MSFSRREFLQALAIASAGGMSLQSNFAQAQSSAKKFYDSLSKRVIAKQIIIDLFAFTLNEMGLAEMIELLNNSGGFIVMHE